MNIIIPIGGIGQRFRQDGYLSPKPLIRYLGEPMIFWIIKNLKLNKEDKIYIIYHKDLRDYHFKDQIRNRFQNLNFKFIELYYQTEGAVETLLLALKNIETKDLDRKIISLDCDTFYTFDVINTYRKIKENCVFYFEDTQDKAIYSYILLEQPYHHITDIKEKVKISSHANTGCYCFQSGNLLLKYCQKLLESSRTSLNIKEYYISSVIKLMLEDQQPFIGQRIESTEFTCLGTPHLLKINSQNPNFHETKRICFDLDHTLVSTIQQTDYLNVKPIWRNINLLKSLKAQGHTIIIYTARRMKTHAGNVGKVIADIAKTTFETLEKYGIEYDEIYFGKPYADYYLDDLAINSYHDLEKELGFYQLNIPERDHHHLEMTNKTVKKSGQVEGEIFWYQHCPEEIRDLIPKLLAFDKKSWYQVERIEGVTLSHYYLNENLTIKIFDEFLSCLERIHNSLSEEVSRLDDLKRYKYDNYIKKLDQRYHDYDYSKFPNHKKVYEKIRAELKNYIVRDVPELYVIHGDPVFTNVLLTKFMNFKFIDMRGKLGNNTLTLYGDILYDYAKVYQSLIGYDEILLNQKVNPEYRQELVNHFEAYILKHFDQNTLQDLKIITASLLFTLIPLHDNEKCSEYYQLIEKLKLKLI